MKRSHDWSLLPRDFPVEIVAGEELDSFSPPLFKGRNPFRTININRRPAIAGRIPHHPLLLSSFPSSLPESWPIIVGNKVKTLLTIFYHLLNLQSFGSGRLLPDVSWKDRTRISSVYHQIFFDFPVQNFIAGSRPGVPRLRCLGRVVGHSCHRWDGLLCFAVEGKGEEEETSPPMRTEFFF